MKDEYGKRIAEALERIADHGDRCAEEAARREAWLAELVGPVEPLLKRVVDDYTRQLDALAECRAAHGAAQSADAMADIVAPPG